jgi:hypothetical protein
MMANWHPLSEYEQQGKRTQSLFLRLIPGLIKPFFLGSLNKKLCGGKSVKQARRLQHEGLG